MGHPTRDLLKGRQVRQQDAQQLVVVRGCEDARCWRSFLKGQGKKNHLTSAGPLIAATHFRFIRPTVYARA
jgi:hypothetical protein